MSELGVYRVSAQLGPRGVQLGIRQLLHSTDASIILTEQRNPFVSGPFQKLFLKNSFHFGPLLLEELAVS